MAGDDAGLAARACGCAATALPCEVALGRGSPVVLLDGPFGGPLPDPEAEPKPLASREAWCAAVAAASMPGLTGCAPLPACATSEPACEHAADVFISL